MQVSALNCRQVEEQRSESTEVRQLWRTMVLLCIARISGSMVTLNKIQVLLGWKEGEEEGMGHDIE